MIVDYHFDGDGRLVLVSFCALKYRYHGIGHIVVSFIPRYDHRTDK